MLRKYIVNLNSKKCWDIHVETSEKLFLSNFKSEGFYATDLKRMCDRYVVDLPGFYGKLFTAKELDHISNLLVEHLQNYIENLGGLDKIEYYTEEELCKIERDESDGIIEAMAYKCGVSINEMRFKILKIKVNKDDKLLENIAYKCNMTKDEMKFTIQLLRM